jgi:hypothetical protein
VEEEEEVEEEKEKREEREDEVALAALMEAMHCDHSRLGPGLVDAALGILGALPMFFSSAFGIGGGKL